MIVSAVSLIGRMPTFPRQWMISREKYGHEYAFSRVRQPGKLQMAVAPGSEICAALRAKKTCRYAIRWSYQGILGTKHKGKQIGVYNFASADVSHSKGSLSWSTTATDYGLDQSRLIHHLPQLFLAPNPTSLAMILPSRPIKMNVGYAVTP